ncbi:transfer protein traD, partial [mine drainage metagenome]
MLWALMAVGVFAIFAIWPKRAQRGVKGKKDVPRPLRGSWVVREDQGRRLWEAELKERELDPGSLVPLGTGYVLPESEMQHVKIVGTSGSGKSMVIKHILAAVEQRPSQRAVIVDPDGGYTRLFFNPERGDVIFNPFDARASGWDLAADV